MYYFTIDDINCESKGIVVTRRPKMPAPVRNYKEYDIPGRNGKLYKDLETYDDMIVSIECNYITHPDNWHQRWRDIKRWLFENNGKMRKLGLSDNPDFYFIIKKIELSDNERTVIESGEFEISLTLEAYQYLTVGGVPYDYKNVLYNPYNNTEPIYILKGEGMATLNINGHVCTANVGQSLIIDTVRRLSYKEDGTPQNTAIKGDYDLLGLVHGKNEITLEGEDISLKIIPNWRCV
jgi:putative phage tail component, N-terminal domain